MEKKNEDTKKTTTKKIMNKRFYVKMNEDERNERAIHHKKNIQNCKEAEVDRSILSIFFLIQFLCSRWHCHLIFRDLFSWQCCVFFWSW